MKPNRIHCFFEQTNTFRDVAASMGYEAESYDIEGNPTHKIDLFKAIEEGDGNEFLSKISKDDLVLAFFPCTYFQVWTEVNIIGKNKGMASWSEWQRIEYSRERERAEQLLPNILQVGFVGYRKGSSANHREPLPEMLLPSSLLPSTPQSRNRR